MGALVGNVDVVIVRFDGNHSVLYGRCLHRGALMCDGRMVGDNIACGLHGWDYLFHTGVSSYDNSERLAKTWSRPSTADRLGTVGKEPWTPRLYRASYTRFCRL